MILRIIIKDLKLILTDKKAIAILVLMPIILTSILSMALSGSFDSGSSINKFTIGIVKEYEDTDVKSAVASKLKNSLIGDSLGDFDIESMDYDPEKIFFSDFLENEEVKEIMGYEVMTMSEAEQGIKDDELSAIVVLPENFIVDSYINMITTFRNKVEIKVIKNPSRNVTPFIAESIVEGYSQIISSMIISKNVYITKAQKYNTGDILGDNLTKFIDLYKVDSRVTPTVERIMINGQPPITSSDYYSVGMMAMFILFGASQGSVMLLKEKKKKTYDRLTVAGIKGRDILISKYCMIFILVALQMTAMLLYASNVLGVNFVNMNLVFVTGICAAFAVSGMGILIGSIMFKSDDYKLAGVMSNGVFQVFALLGGSYIPIEVMPKMFAYLSNVPINGLVMKSFLKIMTGYGFNDIKLYLGLMLLNGIVMLGIGVAIFEKGEKAYVGYTEA